MKNQSLKSAAATEEWYSEKPATTIKIGNSLGPESAPDAGGCALYLTHSHSPSHSLSLYHTLSRSLSHTLTLSHSLTLSLSLTLTHALSRTLYHEADQMQVELLLALRHTPRLELDQIEQVA